MMNARTTHAALALTALTLASGTTPAFAAEGFRLESSAFEDNGLLDSRYAAKGGPRECDGENVSPPLQWSSIPDGTRSLAIVVHDAVGNHGLGVSHWVGYGIPSDTSYLAEGAINEASAGADFVGGTNRIGTATWFGPCPDVGDVPHHYEFTLIATDLAPDALEPGLDRASLLNALDGHALGATSLIGRYARQ